MHSPYEAVYGFDRTHIRRMTVEEYMREDESSAGVASAPHRKKERRMHSRDPNVQFSSKYPVYDRFGHEICVLYQMLEMEVQKELQRVKGGDDMTRRSAVHFSTGVAMLDGAADQLLVVKQEQQQQQQQQQHEVVGCMSVHRPTPFVHAAFVGGGVFDDDDDDIDVSASSAHQLSGVTSSSSQRCTGTGTRTVRVSSFSIYRDSGAGACTKLPQPQSHQQSEVISDGSHSAIAMQTFVPGDVNTNMSCLPDGFCTFRPLPRPRSNTASPVHSGSDGGSGVLEGFDAACAEREARDTCAEANPLRLTTVRPSDMRTTKQLFVPGRTTTTRCTIRHVHPIPSRMYGMQSRAIPAAVVAPHIAANLAAFCAGRDFWSIDDPMPQLHPGAVLMIGEHRYRILYYHASSDVYEAREEEAVEGEEDGTTAVLQTRPTQQILMYHWSVRAVQENLNEAHRAALGLSLTSVVVGVAGCRYRDGGLTVITMPEGYRAIPLSSVPMSDRSFPTCVKLLLRMLSDLVVKRTIHGNLKALNRIFLAIRPADASTDMPVAVLVPIHWERLVDFSMFVDRNAGRTIPIVDECGSRMSDHVYHGRDVSMVTSMLLECEHAKHLQSDQLIEAQRLMMMTTEFMQIANYLIQLNNTMAAIPSNLEALRQEYEVALQSTCHGLWR